MCRFFLSVLFVLSVYAYLNVPIDATRESPVAWGSWMKSNIPAGPQGTPILTKWPNPQILEYKVLIVHLVPASHFRKASSCRHIAAGLRNWGMVAGSRKQPSYQSSAASPVTKHFSGCCKCQSECQGSQIVFFQLNGCIAGGPNPWSCHVLWHHLLPFLLLF